MNTSMVDTAFEEGWTANVQDFGLDGNPYAQAGNPYRLADMLREAWRLGWMRAELARETACTHAVVQRQRALFSRLGWP